MIYFSFFLLQIWTQWVACGSFDMSHYILLKKKQKALIESISISLFLFANPSSSSSSPSLSFPLSLLPFSLILRLKKVDVKPSKYRVFVFASSCMSICTQQYKMNVLQQQSNFHSQHILQLEGRKRKEFLTNFEPNDQKSKPKNKTEPKEARKWFWWKTE